MSTCYWYRQSSLADAIISLIVNNITMLLTVLALIVLFLTVENGAPNTTIPPSVASIISLFCTRLAEHERDIPSAHYFQLAYRPRQQKTPWKSYILKIVCATWADVIILDSGIDAVELTFRAKIWCKQSHPWLVANDQESLHVHTRPTSSVCPVSTAAIKSSKDQPWVVTLHIFNYLVTVRTSELNVTSATFVNRLVGSPVAVDLPAKE